MKRIIGLLIGGGLLIGLALLGKYAAEQAEPYQKTIKHGAAPEVSANPYLAAEMFLRKRKIEVSRSETLAGLDDLPAAGHTLLLLANRSDMTPRQARRLLEWTAKGGHLVFIAESLWDEEKGKSEDLLLDSVGIHQIMTEELDADDESEDEEASEDEPEHSASESEEQAQDDDEEERYPELTKIYLENEEAPAYIGFDTEYHLYDTNDKVYAWANSGEATHMMQLDHGEGLVTVLTDAWIWQNDEIADYDNAWLLWYLTQDTSVTLVYNTERDNLASQLLEHYPLALVVLVLLIIASLWHVGLRHGPLQVVPERARRQLEEHLRGGADFLLRHSGQQHLLLALQRDILRRARHRHPGFERLAIADQWHALGRLTRLPSSAISQAMKPSPVKRMSATDFTRQVANLQTLRNAL
ncbi:DUF4350 domain-containing protein [Pseudomonas sp. LRF_L74]|uniref:DUF4350 domain-containing protein n=1 Tax=Pseudomonas sp. LRF_L74 TaxID=3369422 RepID=UPI003F61F81E